MIQTSNDTQYIFVAIVWAALAVFAVWAVPDVENFAISSPLTERLKAMKDFDYVGTIMTVCGTGMLTASLTYATFLMCIGALRS